MNAAIMKGEVKNEIRSILLDIIKDCSSEYNDVRYFRCWIIPYSTRQIITKMRQKISHIPMEETVFAFTVGELDLIVVKMLVNIKIIVTRVTILPGFSGWIVKLT